MVKILTPPALLFALLLSGCGGAPTKEANADNAAAPAATSFAWPASLRPIGDGYPVAGNNCRRVGESAATSNYLDDSAVLVGCPGTPDGAEAQALISSKGGRVVGEVDGVTLISVPMGDANQGMPAAGAAQVDESVDAKVKGTNFNATGDVACSGLPDGQAAGRCQAGVVRKTDGSADLTVTWPDKRTRTLFFDAKTNVSGADTSQADGSAKYAVKGIRKAPDLIIVTIGPERYEIPDALIVGG
ncbi:hypothetical protein ACFB49_31810 [Sphingomonas sp. DBB INV C78]|uniref:hypothetical protein n=1 Tax=Sphingomonas sp. DBB INV C78 TaxID=3349434 RepID=UPI0036D2CD38